jgi:3-oxoacyl-[acyl-carrier protein] reductase
VTWIVTGASRGIGRAVAVRLAARGEAVLGVHRRPGESASALASTHPNLQLLQADLGARVGIDALVQRAGAHAVRGLVLAAGIAIRAPFTSLDHDGVDPLLAQLRLDLEAPLLLVRAALRAEVFAADASIVFVSSNLARYGLADKVAYGAAKAGLEGAVRGLARELGPAGIRVNAIAPGLLRTDMTADVGDDAFAAYAEQVPLRRVGTADDIAPAIDFLLGEGASYITGQVLDVDGGW